MEHCCILLLSVEEISNLIAVFGVSWMMMGPLKVRNIEQTSKKNILMSKETIKLKNSLRDWIFCEIFLIY